MLTLRNVGGCLSPPEIAVSGCKVTNINCKPKAPAKKILLPAKYPPRARVPTRAVRVRVATSRHAGAMRVAHIGT